MTALDGPRRPLNVGIAGLGRFGKLHCGVLSRFPHVRIAAICDPAETELAAVGERFAVPARYAALDQMLEPRPISTPSFSSRRSSCTPSRRTRRSRAGCRPSSKSRWRRRRRRAAGIADAARAAGVYLQIGFVLRFETQHALLKAEIDAGRFGDIVTLRVKRNCSRAWFEVYGDRAHSVFETVIHDIDLAIWFTESRCRTVYAVQRFISGRTFPDACVAIVQFENGTLCTVETSWFVPDRAPANVLTESWTGTIDAELEIVGTRQSARLRLLESGLQIWTDDVAKHPESGLWPDLHGQVAGALREEDAHFIDRVATGTPSPVASVDDAVEGLRIAEAIIRSAESGEPVSLN